jgi:hypothetical protein
MVIGKLQQAYAFAIFLMRDFFRSASDDGLSTWKAQLVMTGAQALLAVTFVFGMSAVIGHRVAVLTSKATFLAFTVALVVGLLAANRRAEQRWLPPFERDFAAFNRKVSASLALVMILALVLIAFCISIVAARGVAQVSVGG